MNLPEPSSVVLTVIDMQEKFLPAIPEMPQTVEKIKILLAAAHELAFPVIVTEQYPKGLGATLTELSQACPEKTFVFEKTSFSCLENETYRKELIAMGRKHLILTGVESHVCVFQTAINALERGYEVCVVADAVASRHENDKIIALSMLRHAGVQVVTTEMLLFMLLKDASHPSFRELSKKIR